MLPTRWKRAQPTLEFSNFETCANARKGAQQVLEFLKQDDGTPETWTRIRFKVIHKKGSVEEVGSWRPICTLPALYKLLSTIIYNRLYTRRDQAQTEDHG